jgi:hypothetical protein
MRAKEEQDRTEERLKLQTAEVAENLHPQP